MQETLKEKNGSSAAPKIKKPVTPEQVFQILESERVIAMVRNSIFENVEAISNAVIAGGVRVVAISIAVPQRFRFIESLAEKNPHVLVGATHVVDGEQAQKAIEAGARFISSAFISKDVISVCRNSDICVMQGAQTATEVMEASRSGADIVQIFPIHLIGGATYIRTIREPLPNNIKLIATGDIEAEHVVDFIKAGVMAVMVDDTMAERGLIRENKWNDITERAKLFTQKIASLKTSK